jgi:hypothetical protein
LSSSVLAGILFTCSKSSVMIVCLYIYFFHSTRFCLTYLAALLFGTSLNLIRILQYFKLHVFAKPFYQMSLRWDYTHPRSRIQIQHRSMEESLPESWQTPGSGASSQLSRKRSNVGVHSTFKYLNSILIPWCVLTWKSRVSLSLFLVI